MNGIARYNLSGALLLALGLILPFFQVDRIASSIEVAYFRVIATTNALSLEWATTREVNVNGFEIEMKHVDEPESAYFPLGSRIAMGGADGDATYNFVITSGLIPGERYCFRLQEIPADDTPGQVFDLCGYGLGQGELASKLFMPLARK